MPTTLSLTLRHHRVRTHASMDYEVIAYFEADQKLPTRDTDIPPWEYSDLAATLVTAAMLPVHRTLYGLTVHPPVIRIRGRRALVKQRICGG